MNTKLYEEHKTDFHLSPCGRGRSFAAGEGYKRLLVVGELSLEGMNYRRQPYILPITNNQTLVTICSPHPPFQGDLSHKGRGIKEALLH